MLTVGMAESPHLAVWLLLTKSAARKLDHDARVCPWSALCDAAERCATGVINTLQHTVGRTINRNVVAQAGLRGPLGGTKLRLSSSRADAHCVTRTQAITELVKVALGATTPCADPHMNSCDDWEPMWRTSVRCQSAEQMVVRAGRMEMSGGTSGSEREMAQSVDPETADRHRSERPRSRQILARSATQTGNGGGTSYQ